MAVPVKIFIFENVLALGTKEVYQKSGVLHRSYGLLKEIQSHKTHIIIEQVISDTMNLHQGPLNLIFKLSDIIFHNLQECQKQGIPPNPKVQNPQIRSLQKFCLPVMKP